MRFLKKESMWSRNRTISTLQPNRDCKSSFICTKANFTKIRIHVAKANGRKVKSPAIPKNNEAFWKRAEDGTRTRDPNLGKVMLYQLSYFRKTYLLKLVYSKRDLNPHSRNGQRILSPSCLPIPPFEHPFLLRDERKTGLEPATLTLARLCSTNWATSALLHCFCLRVQR